MCADASMQKGSIKHQLRFRSCFKYTKKAQLVIFMGGWPGMGGLGVGWVRKKSIELSVSFVTV